LDNYKGTGSALSEKRKVVPKSKSSKNLFSIANNTERQCTERGNSVRKEDIWALPLYIHNGGASFLPKTTKAYLTHQNPVMAFFLEDPLIHSSFHLIRNGSLMCIICKRGYPWVHARGTCKPTSIEAISKALGPISRMQGSCMIGLRHPNSSAGRGKGSKNKSRHTCDDDGKYIRSNSVTGSRLELLLTCRDDSMFSRSMCSLDGA